MINDFLSLFFPNTCFACGTALGKSENLICLPCFHELPKTDYHKAKNLTENPIHTKFQGKVHVSYALAYLKFYKKGKVQRLLYQFKYRNKPKIGEYLGFRYGKELEQNGFGDIFDLILPVPLHPAKRRSRGYNQSDYFAVGLSEGLGVPWSDKVLLRQQRNISQTRKSRLLRWRNVADAFRVSPGTELRDKHILLVDDVVTTGATLDACAQALDGTGIAALSIATLAEAHS